MSFTEFLSKCNKCGTELEEFEARRCNWCENVICQSCLEEVIFRKVDEEYIEEVCKDCKLVIEEERRGND